MPALNGRRRGGIGKAIGLKPAKLGMRIAGSGNPEDEDVPPGSREFGRRAWVRRRRLEGKRDFNVKVDPDLKYNVRKV